MFKLVVLSLVLAVAAAKPSAIAPLGLGWHGAWGAHLAAPLAAPVVAAPLAAHVAAPAVAVAAAPAIAAYNYRGPLSLAPGQPANILAHDGRPLDTLNVNVDRAVHYTAKAVDHAAAAGHWVGKRSAPLFAGPAAAYSHVARVDVPARVLAPAPLAAAHLAAAPLGWHAPVAPLGLGHLGLGHAAGHIW